MNFYQIALCGQNLAPLTYASSQPLAPGRLVSAPLRGRRLRGVVLADCAQPAFRTLSCEALDEALTPLQMQLLRFVAEYYACEPGMAAALFTPTGLADLGDSAAGGEVSAANDCVAKSSDLFFAISQNPTGGAKTGDKTGAAGGTTGLAKIGDKKPRSTSALFLRSEQQPIAQLSAEQARAYEQIAQSPAALLFGDTGSGKTELYIHAIARTLEQGKQVLFLMPEISLTPQMCERIARHFAFGLWHSKITKSAKQKVLKALASGQISLILGARSALFLPWTNLGLIIVDEEHDGSYKSAKYPCVNARDLALFIGAKCGAQVILGSATPSLASAANARLALVRLRGTYFSSAREVVFDDSREQPSEQLIAEIAAQLAAGRVSLIFLPLRANFRQVVCKSCGSVAMCPRCSVAMSLHKTRYRCHYCGFSAPFSPQCAACGSEVLEGRKMGTAQLADELEKALAERGLAAKIARLDSDTASSPRAIKSILADLAAGRTNVLVGTQMMAKGHDYHNIGFCAILGLDSYLYYPEFSAREATLALAIQVAGRAGRAGRARVMIATNCREFFERYLNDYELFLHEEAPLRQHFAPYKRLLRFIIQSRDEAEAASICEQLAGHLIESRKSENDYELLGYGPCALAKINNFYRYAVLVRSEHKMLLSRLAAHYKSLQKVTIDIDPLVFS